MITTEVGGVMQRGGKGLGGGYCTFYMIDTARGSGQCVAFKLLHYTKAF